MSEKCNNHFATKHCWNALLFIPLKCHYQWRRYTRARHVNDLAERSTALAPPRLLLCFASVVWTENKNFTISDRWPLYLFDSDLARGCSDLEMTWPLCCAGAATGHCRWSISLNDAACRCGLCVSNLTRTSAAMDWRRWTGELSARCLAVSVSTRSVSTTEDSPVSNVCLQTTTTQTTTIQMMRMMMTVMIRERHCSIFEAR